MTHTGGDIGFSEWAELWRLAEAAGASGLPEETLARLRGHVALTAEWNARAGLVATNEVDRLWQEHVVDSLSLLPCLPAGRVLDIGSGGGFPAIPLAAALPDREFVLLERSKRKVGFLRRVITTLGLKNTTLLHGSFPEAPLPRPAAITARAVERPDAFVRKLAAWMPEDAVFLCQTSQEDPYLAQWFHVEHIEDEWTRKGWRRGALRLLRPKI